MKFKSNYFDDIGHSLSSVRAVQHPLIHRARVRALALTVFFLARARTRARCKGGLNSCHLSLYIVSVSRISGARKTLNRQWV